MEELFLEWIASNELYSNHFVRDGIIDEDKWLDSKRKILFILKETNDFEDDLRKLIRKWNGPKYQVFHTVARWAYGLQNLTHDFIPSHEESHKFRKDGLLSSAVVNLKKITGTRTADNDVIKEFALRDSDFIRRQFDLIKPEIVVCGGTFYAVKLLFNISQDHKIADEIYYKDRILFIKSYHPAYTRLKRTEMYAHVVQKVSDAIATSNININFGALCLMIWGASFALSFGMNV